MRLPRSASMAPRTAQDGAVRRMAMPPLQRALVTLAALSMASSGAAPPVCTSGLDCSLNAASAPRARATVTSASSGSAASSSISCRRRVARRSTRRASRTPPPRGAGQPSSIRAQRCGTDSSPSFTVAAACCPGKQTVRSCAASPARRSGRSSDRAWPSRRRATTRRRGATRRVASGCCCTLAMARREAQPAVVLRGQRSFRPAAARINSF